MATMSMVASGSRVVAVDGLTRSGCEQHGEGKHRGWQFPWSEGLIVGLARGRSMVAPLVAEHLRGCRKGKQWRLLPLRAREAGDFVGGGGDIGSGGGGGGGGGSGGGEGDGSEGERDGLGSSSGALAVLWSRYLQSLDKNPVLVKGLTAGAMNALADFICQVGIEHTENVDVQRLLSFAAIGLVFSGPGMHYWYGLLPKIIPAVGLKGLALRIAADQLVFTPLGMLSFFVILLALEGRQQQIGAKLQKDWLPTVYANWTVWVPFQIVNFGFVPPQLQVAAAGVLGMVWTIFISYKGHS